MKRIVSIVLLACLLCSLFAGCKAKKQANSATDVEVVYWEAGDGRAWLDQIVKNFNESQDKYHATVVASAENRISEITRGDVTGDLYIGAMNTFNAYQEYLYPLNDLLAIKVDGEDGLSIGEKFGNFLEVNKHSNGNVYAIPGPVGAVHAIMYNVDMMVDANGNPYKLPNTTNELEKLCLDLFSDGRVPFIHYAEYWHFIYESWIAQYLGEDAFWKTWNAIYVDKNGVEHADDVRAITENEGRYEAYKVLERLLAPKGYTYTNTNSFTHTTAQTYFLAGKAVMMPNGSWLENEMGGDDAAANILPMKTPVISTLAGKLGIRSDKHLSLIVDYVDGTELTETEMSVVNGYSAEVIEEVRKARAIHYAGQPMQLMIPKYSNCTDGALELIKYIYSDEGLKIVSEKTGGPTSVRFSDEDKVDTSSWTPFMQECYKISQSGNLLKHFLNKPIFYLTGTEHIKINDPVRFMTYRTDGGIMSADEYWAKEKSDWEAKWPQMKIDAGLQ